MSDTRVEKRSISLSLILPILLSNKKMHDQLGFQAMYEQWIKVEQIIKGHECTGQYDNTIRFPAF